MNAKRLATLPPLLAALVGCQSQTQWPTTPPADKCGASAVAPGEYALRFYQGELFRQTIVWVPKGPGPHDVVVDLHEHNADPDRQAHYSKWIEQAERIDAILVAPDGKAATWNAGGCCGKAMYNDIDDVGYLDDVVKRIDDVACTSGRVLATGIGAGGMMAHRWACESDVPDAVISVGGALQRDKCLGTRPIPVLHYHGARDTWMPMDGSGGHAPVAHAMEEWAKRNHATEQGISTVDGATCRDWTGDAPIRFCVVPEMGPVWPGAADAPAKPDATVDGWAWVQQAWAASPP